jgi:hypothetical protein
MVTEKRTTKGIPSTVPLLVLGPTEVRKPLLGPNRLGNPLTFSFPREEVE